jgi:hypothetical protein
MLSHSSDLEILNLLWSLMGIFLTSFSCGTVLHEHFRFLTTSAKITFL